MAGNHQEVRVLMKKMHSSCSFVGAGFALFAAVAAAFGQAQPIEQIEVRSGVGSGPVVNTTKSRTSIYAAVASAPEAAPWIRLSFAEAELGANPGGQPTILRMTSLLDGAVQTMEAHHLVQWQNTSAYFNGSAVVVEIIADPGAASSTIGVDKLWAGVADGGGVATICGTDDRVLSNDPRVARLMPIGCTGWLFNDHNRTFLTAGHCSGASMQVAQFNVPMSTSSGGLVHPPPSQQYSVDVSSKQFVSGGVGNDWGYFGCFANSTTGLTPYQAQRAFYVLGPVPAAVSGQQIRITGHGTDSTPQTHNQVQQTHSGPLHNLTATAVRYRTDTTGGNSGSAVFNETNGVAIGIHTHGGCGSSPTSSNAGTRIDNAGLQNALANPLGVCIPAGPGPADLDGDGSVGPTDLGILLGAWGPNTGHPADLNGDGTVGPADLGVLLGNWG